MTGGPRQRTLLWESGKERWVPPFGSVLVLRLRLLFRFWRSLVQWQVSGSPFIGDSLFAQSCMTLLQARGFTAVAARSPQGGGFTKSPGSRGQVGVWGLLNAGISAGGG